MTEVTFEAIPQSIIQTMTLLLTPPDDRSSLQYISLFSSVLTTAITAALADKELDISKYYRKDEPHLFGYVAKEFATKQLTAFITCLTSYGTAKTLSVAIFFTSVPSSIISCGWFGMEYLGFLAWRMY